MVKQGVEGAVDRFAPGWAQPDLHAAPVVRVGRALHQPAGDESVDPVGHGAAGDEGFVHELAGGQPIGLAGAPQGGEHVEFPRLKVMTCEGLSAGPVEVVRQAGHPAQDMHGRDVPVGSFTPPGGDQSIDFVLGHEGILRFKILDIERIRPGIGIRVWS